METFNLRPVLHTHEIENSYQYFYFALMFYYFGNENIPFYLAYSSFCNKETLIVLFIGIFEYPKTIKIHQFCFQQFFIQSCIAETPMHTRDQ